MGCPAVMPLAAPIGSGMGIRNAANLRIILETVEVPVIVDAGVGTASDAALAMELGATAVLMNTGIAHAKDPVAMAEAMLADVLAEGVFEWIQMCLEISPLLQAVFIDGFADLF